jgi:hypothetical protein
MVGLMFMVLLFGVQWFCSPFPIERCPEMELVKTCSSTSHSNVSFVYAWYPCSICSVEQLGKIVNDV